MHYIRIPIYLLLRAREMCCCVWWEPVADFSDVTKVITKISDSTENKYYSIVIETD